MLRYFKIIIPFLLLADIFYSFAQHFYTTLDGDMAAIILPAEWYQAVLKDPFGIAVVLEGEKYGGAGRFFCHWSMGAYFKKVPLLLQNFSSPVNSVYFSVAIIKTLVQILFIGLLAACISGTADMLKRNFQIAALLVTPLFQTHGYNLYMGIIEKSPTYAFFYSLPLALLLLFLVPFFLTIHFGKKIKWRQQFILFPLIILLPFSGPLIPAVVLLVGCLFVFHGILYRQFGCNHIKGLRAFFANPLVAGFILLFILSAYSFHVGRFNVENSAAIVPLTDRYLALATGVFKILTQKLGLPLLFLSIIFNYCWVHKIKRPDKEQVKVVMKWLSLFSVLYLLLLPLGGFRDYRAFIIRHDSMMPVTICLVFLFGFSTFYLLKNIGKKYRIKYTIGVAAFLAIFTFADLPNFQHNACEKNALNKISDTDQEIILLENECTVMAWDKITNPNDSWWNVQLLKQWQIVDSDRLYYQEKSD